jgi:hypothetical protein
MRSYLKHTAVAALSAVTIAGACVATSTDVQARPFGGGFHGGWHGGFHGGGWRGGFHRGWGGWGFAPVFAGALAFGALAAAPYYYGYGAYPYDDCALRRRIVGYTAWGQPIVRLVRACYY